MRDLELKSDSNQKEVVDSSSQRVNENLNTVESSKEQASDSIFFGIETPTSLNEHQFNLDTKDSATIQISQDRFPSFGGVEDSSSQHHKTHLEKIAKNDSESSSCALSQNQTFELNKMESQSSSKQVKTLHSVEDLLALLKEIPQKRITINGEEYDLDLCQSNQIKTTSSENTCAIPSSISNIERNSNSNQQEQKTSDEFSNSQNFSSGNTSNQSLVKPSLLGQNPPNVTFSMPSKETPSINFDRLKGLISMQLDPQLQTNFLPPPLMNLPITPSFLPPPFVSFGLPSQPLTFQPPPPLPLAPLPLPLSPEHQQHLLSQTLNDPQPPQNNINNQQLKKTRSEMHPPSSLGFHKANSKGMLNVSSQFIIRGNVESKSRGDIAADKEEAEEVVLIKENQELRKRIETQKVELQQLKAIQRQLSQYVVQHSTIKNIASNIDDENILEILQQAHVSNAKIHLSFLFASPLVIHDEKKNRFDEIDQIDHNKEFSGVCEMLSSLNKLIKYQKIQATLGNLTQTLTDNPIALHFSGHGIREARSFNQVAQNGKLKGYLVIEDEQGQSNFLPAQSLKNMLQSQGCQPEFVFVASCHSQFAGQIFHEARAKHVICVKENFPISDEASILFAKFFYKALFSSRQTVCEAFYIAKQYLKNHSDPLISSESEKFMILKDTDRDDDIDLSRKKNTQNLAFYGLAPVQKKKHQCTIFGPFADGSLTNISNDPLFKIDTSKVEDFLGRTQEMHQVICCILNKRIVNVMGIPGIGKTTLIKAVAHYIDERNLFKDGIIMLSLRNLDQASMILTRLELTIAKKVKDFLTSQTESISAPDSNGDSKPIDQRALLDKIANFFKLRTVLLVLDNAETPSKKDPKNFAEIIQTLLDQCPGVKFLFTSRYNIGSYENNAEQVIELKQLQMKYAVDLLKRKAPRPIEIQEIDELLKIKPTRVLHSNPMMKRDDSNGGLENHHMFEILNGHPHAISLAAPLLQNKKLKELYELLNSEEIMNWLENHGNTDTAMCSLKVSMDISIKQLTETEAKAIKIFWLIGLMPGGCSEIDLNVLWGSGWLNEIEKLLRASLLVKKSVANENVYQLFPFMNQYASNNMNSTEKKLLHEKIAKYLVQVCKDLLKLQSLEARIDKLVSIETNIWACIYRMRDQVIETECRARSPAVSFWQNSSSRATPIGSSILKHSANQSETESSKQLNRPSLSGDSSKYGPQAPPNVNLEDASSYGEGERNSQNLMLMGIDNLSSEQNFNDQYESILSKKNIFTCGFSNKYGKERSKSEKVLKNMRGGGPMPINSELDEEIKQVEDQVEDEKNESQLQSNMSSKLNFYKIEDESNNIGFSKNHFDDQSFDQSIIIQAPSIARKSSLGAGEHKRFENLILESQMPVNQQNNSMDLGFNGLFNGADQQQISKISQAQSNRLGNSGFPSFLASQNLQVLNQSFSSQNNNIQFGNFQPRSNFKPNNFTDDYSIINDAYLEHHPLGIQDAANFQNFETTSVNSIENQLLQLNTSSMNQAPSFMGGSNLNNSQVIHLDQSNYLYQSFGNRNKVQQQFQRPNLPQISPEVIQEESMLSYAEDELTEQSLNETAQNLAIDSKLDPHTADHQCEQGIKTAFSDEPYCSIRRERSLLQIKKEESSSDSNSDDEIDQSGSQEVIRKNSNSSEDQKLLEDNQAPPPSLSVAENLMKDIQDKFLDDTIDSSDYLNKDNDLIINGENNRNLENNSKIDSYYYNQNREGRSQTGHSSSFKKSEKQETRNEKQTAKRVTIQEDLPDKSNQDKEENGSNQKKKNFKNKPANIKSKFADSKGDLPTLSNLKVSFPQELRECPQIDQGLMSVDGSLMIYYITNLIMMCRFEDGQKVIEQFGLKMEQDQICQANIKKIQAYAEVKNANYLEAKKKYEEALKIFNANNSIHGQAICNYALGFLLYSQTTHFIKNSNENKVFDLAKKKLETAIQCFSKIEHLSGESECHRTLIFIKNKNKENTQEHFKRQKALMKDENRLQSEGRSSFIFLHCRIELSLSLEVVGASPLTIVSNPSHENNYNINRLHQVESKKRPSAQQSTILQSKLVQKKTQQAHPLSTTVKFPKEDQDVTTTIAHGRQTSSSNNKKKETSKQDEQQLQQPISQIPRITSKTNKLSMSKTLQESNIQHITNNTENSVQTSAKKANRKRDQEEIKTMLMQENEEVSKEQKQAIPPRERVNNQRQNKHQIVQQVQQVSQGAQIQKKYAFGTTMILSQTQNNSSKQPQIQNTQNLKKKSEQLNQKNHKEVEETKISYHKQEISGDYLSDNETLNEAQIANTPPEIAIEDLDADESQTKTCNQIKQTSLNKFKFRPTVSPSPLDIQDKIIAKGPQTSRNSNLQRPLTSLSNQESIIKKAKQKIDEMNLNLRPQSSGSQKLIKQQMMENNRNSTNTSSTNLNNTQTEKKDQNNMINQQQQSDRSSHRVSFNITTTTTITIEGQIIPSSIVINPQLSIENDDSKSQNISEVQPNVQKDTLSMANS